MNITYFPSWVVTGKAYDFLMVPDPDHNTNVNFDFIDQFL